MTLSVCRLLLLRKFENGLRSHLLDICSKTRCNDVRHIADSKISKGTTFAARARAAELNSARAAAAAKEAMTSGGEGTVHCLITPTQIV